MDSEIWTRIEIFTSAIAMPSDLRLALDADESTGDVAGKGPVIVRESTNDDNDDGEEDPEVARWFLRFADLEAAKRHAGVSRVGAWGNRVTVLLDGHRLE